MGQIKNIKLHIVTDIKVNRSKVTTRMAVLTEDGGNVVAMDEATVAMETEVQRLYNDVLQTSRFFTSLVELLPAKFYLGHRGEEEENVFNPKHMKKRKKKKPPADKSSWRRKQNSSNLIPHNTKLLQNCKKRWKRRKRKNSPKISPASPCQRKSNQSACRKSLVPSPWRTFTTNFTPRWTNFGETGKSYLRRGTKLTTGNGNISTKRNSAARRREKRRKAETSKYPTPSKTMH